MKMNMVIAGVLFLFLIGVSGMAQSQPHSSPKNRSYLAGGLAMTTGQNGVFIAGGLELSKRQTAEGGFDVTWGRYGQYNLSINSEYVFHPVHFFAFATAISAVREQNELQFEQHRMHAEAGFKLEKSFDNRHLLEFTAMQSTRSQHVSYRKYELKYRQLGSEPGKKIFAALAIEDETEHETGARARHTSNRIAWKGRAGVSF